MGIVFTEKDKSLELDIIGYEFPEIGKKDDIFDANWLIAKVEYKDELISFCEEEACLQSFELDELTKRVDAVATGEGTGFVQHFTEPFLLIEITRSDDCYTVKISYTYLKSEDNLEKVNISQIMSLNELIEMNSQLKAMYRNFPYRAVD